MTLDETVRYVMETEWLEFDVRQSTYCYIRCNDSCKCVECRFRYKEVRCLKNNYWSTGVYEHIRNNYPEELV